MEFLKQLFESGAIDWDVFSKGVAEKGFKLVDLSKGEYVSKNKYEDDITSKDNEIKTLTSQLSDRDKDLKALNKQLKDAGTDSQKLSELSTKLNDLQTDYDNAKTNYEKQLAATKYEYAVKEFANEQKFTSAAAKRDFIHGMIEKSLQMGDNGIIGAKDYLESYKADNSDSFIVDDSQKQESTNLKPQFTQKTGSNDTPNANPFDGKFNFIGVRPFSNEK